MTWLVIFSGFGLLVGALFCAAEAFIGWHLKAGTDVGAGVVEQMLVPKAERERLRSRLAAEVHNPENKVERRWLIRAAALAVVGLLVVFSPVLFNP